MLKADVSDDDALLSIIRQWRKPEPVNRENIVCQNCWNLAQKNGPEGALEIPSQVGHASVCLRCGRSLLAQRVTHLHIKTTRESAIYNMIREWVLPRAVGETNCICHSCWVLADRAAVHMTTGPSNSSHSNPPPIQMRPQSPDTPSVPPDEYQDNLPDVNIAPPMEYHGDNLPNIPVLEVEQNSANDLPDVTIVPLILVVPPVNNPHRQHNCIFVIIEDE